MNVNVEIVLDASGSMAKKIDGVPMMDIAKNSISSVLEGMPANANVGPRVFGHKGNNTESGREEPCAANELVHPIELLNIEGIKNALAPIQPTGWTSIASSIENGVKDLSAFQGEKDLNILYIVTDGIETCGGSAVGVAERLKNENTNIVLGIIGFNVDANQNKILSDIAAVGGGYYANANDAAKLTTELQNLHELAYYDYKWETLDEKVFEKKLKSYHRSGLFYNKTVAVQRGAVSEHNDLNTLI